MSGNPKGEKPKADLPQYDQKMVEDARSRRFKAPFDLLFIESDPKSSVVLPNGKMQVKHRLGKHHIETMADLIIFDRRWREGEISPMPDMGIQVLNIIMDMLGLIEGPTGAGKG